MPIQYRLCLGREGTPDRDLIRKDHSIREMVESLKGGCVADLYWIRSRLDAGCIWWIEVTGIKSEVATMFVTDVVHRVIGKTFGI